MNTSSHIPEAADAAASGAALTTSITPTPGVHETPDALPPVTAMQTCGDVQPTVVQATPIVPGPALPKAMGLTSRQRTALQALASGMGPQAAARLAGVSPVTVFRWRKYDTRFMAAYNAWKAESFRTAEECLAAANEHAAHTILMAVKAGDVRASLAVMRGLGTLTPQKCGPEFARLVEQERAPEVGRLMLSFGKLPPSMRPDDAWKEVAEKRAADSETGIIGEREAQRRDFVRRYIQIPPLTRPLTLSVMQEAARAWAPWVTTYPKRCTFFITAVAPANENDRASLVARLASDLGITSGDVQSAFNMLPWLLNLARPWAGAEAYAKELESLGARIEMRAAWVQ